ncbi:MAG: hypothetical protein QNJ36_11565 [Calothrix sp. MO_167.B42]|nr:hypothetical protein [Calothrix sp. MO_167.B42]
MVNKIDQVPNQSKKEAPETISKISKEFLKYIDDLKGHITVSKKLLPEEKIREKTLHCLTNIENYIESHIDDSENLLKLDEQKFNEDMKAILEENNSMDIVSILEKMDKKIAKDKKAELLLNDEVNHYLIKVLSIGTPQRQIGRIWA